MSCFTFDEEILRPLGRRCKDFKQHLLENSHAVDQELLAKILEKIYFGKVGEPGQKKGVVITQNTDLLNSSEQPILVYVLLDGEDNLEFTRLMEQAKNYTTGLGYNTVTFTGLQLILRTYNKCFCDRCIYGHLYRPWFAITGYFYRVFAYDGFYIGIYQFFTRYAQGISLIQQAINAATPRFKCCQSNYRTRDQALWLSEGTEPMTSVCILAPKRSLTPSFITLSWRDLPIERPYLYKDISANILEVYTMNGYILHINDFPMGILFHLKDSNDLFFIYRTRRNFKITVYDINYMYKKAKYF